MESTEALKVLYSEFMERWNFMTRLKGEYNEGYADGVLFAMSAANDMIRKLTPKNKVQHVDDQMSLFKDYKKDKNAS